MNKTITKKELYKNLKAICQEVMEKGISYTVYQYSKPAFNINPLKKLPKKKYTKKDIDKLFPIPAKNGKENLATTFKKELYK